MVEGRYANWIAAAWCLIATKKSMKKSFGLWCAAPMPMWEAGKNVISNLGRSIGAQ
jgi:multiple sugar transport system substrate-binding protein